MSNAAAISALIALTGVLVSVLVSLVVARRKMESDLTLAKLNIQSQYASRLCEQRLEHYPPLYKVVQSFAQAIQTRGATFTLLLEVQKEVATWYSEHSLLLGIHATDRVYRYHRFLRQIAAKGEPTFQMRLADHRRRRDLIRRSWAVGLALKNDLGIFEVEFGAPGTKFWSFEEVDGRLGEESPSSSSRLGILKRNWRGIRRKATAHNSTVERTETAKGTVPPLTF